MMNVTWDDVKIANARIKECEKRRTYFVEQFKLTGKQFYANMAESETDMIKEINDAICEASAYLKSKGINQ